MKISRDSLAVVENAVMDHLHYLTCIKAESCPAHKRDYRRWLNVWGKLMMMSVRLYLIDQHSECQAKRENVRQYIKLVGGQPK